MSEEKKIIIDEDWKSQVESEQEAAKQEEEATEPAEPETSADTAAESVADPVAETTSDTDPASEAGTSTPEDPSMPPASLGMLMSSLATEALISMGQFPHPATGESIPGPPVC